jgi:chaperone required for assembly of F1-ATPase
MPLMVLASTAVDTVAPDRDTVVRNVLRYLPTDTALFLAPAEQRILLKKQRQHFDPLTRWARQEFGLDLRPSESLLGRIALPAEVLARAEAVVRSMVGSMVYTTVGLSIYGLMYSSAYRITSSWRACKAPPWSANHL